MSKFKVGDQYLTKGGWRAVVVDTKDNGKVLFWHSNGEKTLWHDFDGAGPISYEYDVTKPYTELRKGTVWVNVWKHREYDEIVSAAYDSEKEYLDELSQDRYYQCIASFKHDWTENEKL